MGSLDRNYLKRGGIAFGMDGTRSPYLRSSRNVSLPAIALTSRSFTLPYKDREP
jgi:hypothetical protein